MLAMHAAALASPSATAIAARTVRALSDHFGLVLPRWRDLTVIERFRLCQLAGKDVELNWTFTFNVSDQQREEWVSTHGGLAEGFRREVIKGLRHIFPDGPNYWFVVEPKAATGAEGDRYRDQPGKPRRFDVHGAIRASRAQLSRLQRSLWARAFKLKKADPSDTHPLQKLGRSACMCPVRDDRWMHYPLKGVSRTVRLHCDVAGDRPFGASQRLHADARARFEEFRRLVIGMPPLTEDVELAMRASIEAVHCEVPATSAVELVVRIERAIRLTLISRFPAEGPRIAAAEAHPAHTGLPADHAPSGPSSPSASTLRPRGGRRGASRSSGFAAHDDNPLLRPIGDQCACARSAS
jgi:hypothetical protein